MKRYHILIIFSLILKSLAVISIILGTGSIGYITVDVVHQSNGSPEGFSVWLGAVLPLVISIFLFAFFCVVLAQISDVLVDISTRLNEIVRHFKTTIVASKTSQSIPVKIETKQ